MEANCSFSFLFPFTQEKKNEIDSLATFLEKLLPDLSLEDGASYKDKMQALYDHWEALRKLLGECLPSAASVCCSVLFDYIFIT